MNTLSTPLNKQLFQMTLPMLAGLLAIMSCHLVDSAFIGQLGPSQLTAIGFTPPIYQLIIGVQVGLGIATTSVISITLGAQNKQNAKQLASLVIITGFILILALCFIIWSVQDSIVLMLGAQPEILPLIHEYWMPWLVSCWLGAMLYFGYSIFRAYGETLLPGLLMILTSLINIILDPVFIFALDMGLAGAAWASCAAFGIGCLILYYQMIKREFLSLPTQQEQVIDGFNRIFSFLTPSMLSQFIPPLSAMLATIVISSHGDLAVAAWGLGSRLELFSIIIVLALTMAMPPIVGRLRGSNSFDQIHQLVKASVIFVLVWQLVVSLLLITFSSMIGGLFTDDRDIMDILSSYLWFLPLSFGALGVCMIMVSVCSALGTPRTSLIISIVRLFACYLPLLWIGSELGGPSGLFIGAMTGNFLAGFLSWTIYKKKTKTLSLNNTLENCVLARSQ